MNWISVEDRLPDEDGYYLVMDTGFYPFEKHRVQKFTANENIHWYGLRTVTHWMPRSPE